MGVAGGVGEVGGVGIVGAMSSSFISKLSSGLLDTGSSFFDILSLLGVDGMLFMLAAGGGSTGPLSVETSVPLSSESISRADGILGVESEFIVVSSEAGSDFPDSLLVISSASLRRRLVAFV